jgi:hypothetical protein
MPWDYQELLKQGGLAAVAAVSIAGCVAGIKLVIGFYRRLVDRNDKLVDRAHDKSESDMRVVADLRATVERQADAIDTLADEVGDLKDLLHRALEHKEGPDEAPRSPG